MTCEELYPRLTDLAEGSLDGDACAEVERHLAECGDCQLVRQDLADLARLCREEQGATTMPTDVRQRIATLLAGQDDESPRPTSPPARD
ncbi:MAG TPA: zf-HC2 domain-containing protein [Vicinamibacteria bacterium]|nr:zf-HC2 domain-containing protein [Vicinamibacteria bacterium]